MTVHGAKVLCHSWNCGLSWSNVIIAAIMWHISHFDKGISQKDAIGVGVLGGVLGDIMGTSTRDTRSRKMFSSYRVV